MAKRRREPEEGFNSIEDRRDERIRMIKEVAKDYLEGYSLRNRSGTFAEYAIGHLTRLLGATMIVDADEAVVLRFQEQRLREKAAPKTINEEVGREARSPTICPVVMLALNAGMRNGAIRHLCSHGRQEQDRIRRRSYHPAQCCAP